MTVFLILATVLVAGSLLLVLPPMLGRGAAARARIARQRQAETVLLVLREQLAELEADFAAGRIDEAQCKRTREELEARALEEGRAADDGADTRPAAASAIVLALAVPLAVVGFYLALGNPEGLDPEKRVAAAPAEQMSREQFAGLVESLVDRLEADPSDLTGWQMLARSYAMLGDVDAAAAAWQRIGSKAPDDAMLLADWADLLVAARQGDFSGEPDRLIARALVIEPGNIKALALAGTAALERGQFAEAAALWERVLEQIPPTEEVYAAVLGSVNEARTQAGMAPLDVPSATTGSPSASSAMMPDAADGALQVSGTVVLAPELADQISPEQVLFVALRPPQGGMPVAALRFTAGELPVSFSFAGVPRMSQGPLPAEVIVAARISAGGDATARSGDLEGFSPAVSVGASGVTVTIDRVRE